MASGLSHFDEKGGVVAKEESWGRWWQTAEEVHIEIKLPEGTKSKDLKVTIRSKEIEVAIGKEEVLKGSLFGIVRVDESTWTVEDKTLLRVQLQKGNYSSTNSFMWESLLKDAYFLDKETMKKAKAKLDLENFQLDNPAFNFSKFKPLGT